MHFKIQLPCLYLMLLHFLEKCECVEGRGEQWWMWKEWQTVGEERKGESSA